MIPVINAVRFILEILSDTPRTGALPVVPPGRVPLLGTPRAPRLRFPPIHQRQDGGQTGSTITPAASSTGMGNLCQPEILRRAERSGFPGEEPGECGCGSRVLSLGLEGGCGPDVAALGTHAGGLHPLGFTIAAGYPPADGCLPHSSPVVAFCSFAIAEVL